MSNEQIKTVRCRMPVGFNGLSKNRYELDGLAGDHITESIEDTGKAYEFNLLARLNAILKSPPRLAVDIGANIGNHSVCFATTFGARVIAIEPNPIAGTLLRTNLERLEKNDFWMIFDCGAGEQSGIGSLRIHPGNLGATELLPSKDEAGKGKGSIEIRTLDRILSESTAAYGLPVDLVKIDVEGMEVGVVRSGLKSLEELRPAMVIEIANIENLREIRSMLEPIGMEFFGPYCATPTYIILPRHRYAPIRYTLWRVLQRLG